MARVSFQSSPQPGQAPPGRVGPGRVIVIVLLVALGLLMCFGGVNVTRDAIDVSNTQAAASTIQQQATAASEQWETVPATTIFPGTVTTAASGIVWNRVAISPPASCQSARGASDQPNPANPCQTVLRATYVDQARTTGAVVAIVVVPQPAQDSGQTADAGSSWQQPFVQISDSLTTPGNSGQPPAFPVNVTPVPGTAAAHFSDSSLIGVGANIIVGNESQWMAMVVESGSLDGRTAGNLPAPWASQEGGGDRDRDGWQYPALNLWQAFDMHYDALFGKG